MVVLIWIIFSCTITRNTRKFQNYKNGIIPPLLSFVIDCWDWLIAQSMGCWGSKIKIIIIKRERDGLTWL